MICNYTLGIHNWKQMIMHVNAKQKENKKAPQAPEGKMMMAIKKECDFGGIRLELEPDDNIADKW